MEPQNNRRNGALFILSVAFVGLSACLLSVIFTLKMVQNENERNPHIGVSLFLVVTAILNEFFLLPTTAQIGRVLFREAMGNDGAFPAHLPQDRNLRFDPFA